jgi:hypothetical protein
VDARTTVTAAENPGTQMLAPSNPGQIGEPMDTV